jgi:hypothetical protein
LLLQLNVHRWERSREADTVVDAPRHGRVISGVSMLGTGNHAADMDR